MGEAVAEAVLAQFAALPKTGKPQAHEHTVLAGIAVGLPAGNNSSGSGSGQAQPAPQQQQQQQQQQRQPSPAGQQHQGRQGEPQQQLVVVALATGTKCLGASKRLAGGLVLNDCHAEVLCRRALLRWLYGEMQAAVAAERQLAQQQRQQQAPGEPGPPGSKAAAGSRVLRLVPAAQPGAGSSSSAASEEEQQPSGSTGLQAGSPGWRFELLPGVSLHMFVSQPPCGDASIIGSTACGMPACAAAGGSCGEALGPAGSSSGRTGAKPVKRRRLEGAAGSPVAASGWAAGGTSPQQQQQQGHEQQDAGWELPQAGDVESYSEAQATGVVRRKPGKGEATLSLSCSDKLARWQLLGLQGSLLSGLLAAPLRLASVTVGSPLPVEGAGESGSTPNSCRQQAAAVEAAVRRALVQRTAEMAGARLPAEQAAAAAELAVHAYLPAPGSSAFARLGLTPTAERKVGGGASVVWCGPPSAAFHVKQQQQQQQQQQGRQPLQHQALEEGQAVALPAVAAAVGCAQGQAPAPRLLPALLAASSGSLEAVAGSTGLRVGSSRKAGVPIKPSACSSVCKAALLEQWQQLVAALNSLPSTRPPAERSCAEACMIAEQRQGQQQQQQQRQQQKGQLSYRQAKAMAGSAYQAAWRALLQPPSPFEGWIPKPAELEDFCLPCTDSAVHI